MIAQQDLKALLTFGYNPWDQSDNIKISGSSEGLVEELSTLSVLESRNRLDALLRHRAETLLQHNNSNFVIPLSGGLDSRAFLALMLEYLPAHRLKTYTYGTKGTLDYEIGNYIARKYRTQHIAIPLEANNYNINSMSFANNMIEGCNMLYLHPPMREVIEFIEDDVVLSGAIMDVLFGKHEYKKESVSFGKAVSSFIEYNSIDATNLMENYKQACSNKHRADFQLISSNHGLDHSLDLSLRQANLSFKHQSYKSVHTEYMFDNAISSFALSLPREMLFNQRLYVDTFYSMNKDLMSLPIKTRRLSGGYLKPTIINKFEYISRRLVGRVKYNLTGTHPRLNYLDWSKMINSSEFVREMFDEGCLIIKKSEIFQQEMYEQFIRKIRDNKSLQYLAIASLPFRSKNNQE